MHGKEGDSLGLHLQSISTLLRDRQTKRERSKRKTAKNASAIGLCKVRHFGRLTDLCKRGTFAQSNGDCAKR